ncbi:MAG: helix-turn-helix domain-containing protein [Lentisphaeria bacterium]|nr:helix-turn-helix domain-containing protein [Lentisphaeria bacterium]
MKNRLLAKTGAVLDALCAAAGPMTVRELAGQLGLPTPTVSRLCGDLAEMGWLEKTDYHHYAPGLALIRFGFHAERLSPFVARAFPLIEAFSVETGLNGLLSGYDGVRFFRICGCAQKSSDRNILRRSGAFLALLFAYGLSVDAARTEARKFYSDLSEVERNTLDREFDALAARKLLLRIGTMRQWYVTVPFLCADCACALTFYGRGTEEQQVERICDEVTQLAARIRNVRTGLARRR